MLYKFDFRILTTTCMSESKPEISRRTVVRVDYWITGLLDSDPDNPPPNMKNIKTSIKCKCCRPLVTGTDVQMY